MTKQKAQKKRPARAAKGFRLNAHRTAIIVGLISMIGVLAASAVTNWDKLRGNQTIQAVAPDTTGDLLAYNEQRRVMVEGAFDEALGHLEEAEKMTTGQDAGAIKEFAASIREHKVAVQMQYDAVQMQYDKVLEAIKDKKPVQADIHKTKLNTMILETQKGYDELRLTQPADSEVPIINDVETSDLRFSWAPVVSSTPAPKYILPSITFPMGRERNNPLKFIILAENADTGELPAPLGLSQYLVDAAEVCKREDWAVESVAVGH
jgi:hypothetical protein